jgi:hypothetical protein
MPYTGTKAQAGLGTTLSIGSTPTEIGETDDLPFDRPEWGTADATNFDSTAEEFITTIQKSMEFTVTGNRVSSDAGQAAAEAAYASGASTPFTVQLKKTATQTTSGDKFTFNALVLGSSFRVQPTGVIKFSLKLKTTGPVTFTIGS